MKCHGSFWAEEGVCLTLAIALSINHEIILFDKKYKVLEKWKQAW